MPRFVRLTAWALLITLIGFAAFYFWASSPTRPAADYAAVTTYDDAPRATPPDTFAVMTYNIGYLSGMTNNRPVPREASLFTQNLDAAADLIARAQPDLVGFQEIDLGARRSYDVDQLDALARRGAFAAAAIAVNWDEHYVPFPSMNPALHFGRVLSGQAVLSRFPILDHERLTLPRPATVSVSGLPSFFAPLSRRFYLDRLAQVVRIDVGGQPVVVINVHLEAYDPETREEQAREVLALYRRYRAEAPTLLIGDFNSLLPGTEAHPLMPPEQYAELERDRTMQVILQGEGLREAFWDGGPLEAAAKAAEAHTLTYAADEPRVKIDHIFYDADRIEAVGAFVLDGAEQPSDHRAVVMRFVLRPDSARAVVPVQHP